MKARLFTVFVLVVGLALLLTWSAAAQGPAPGDRELPGRGPIQHPSGRGIEVGDKPFPRPPSSPGPLGAQDVSAAVALGQPGTVYRYVSTFGETEVAYFEDAAHLYNPYGVGVDGAGNIWVAEILGARAMKYTGDGSFVMSIGTAGLIGRADDTHFYGVADVAVDSSSNIWVVDWAPARVVEYDSDGNYLTQLGITWESGSDNDHFDGPHSIAFDSAGNIYVSDAGNQRIQVFNSSGTYNTTIGVTGVPGSDSAHFDTPRHIAIDSSNNRYVADAGNHRVQKFNSSRLYVRTFGTSGVPYLTDSYHYNEPYGMVTGASGNMGSVENEDRGNRFIKLNSGGTPQLTIGQAGIWGSDNAHLDGPRAVAFDSSGNIYILLPKRVVDLAGGMSGRQI